MKRKGSSAGPKPVPGPPKSEPRRKKQLTNPAEGMVVSSRGAQALIAKGAADRTKNDASTRQESGAVSTANSAAPTLPSNSGMPTGPRLGTFSTVRSSTGWDRHRSKANVAAGRTSHPTSASTR